MPAQDQLEIITPGGEIKFYDLEPRKGIANIGRHPDNDIVIYGHHVRPFHAVLDYSQKPLYITLLNPDGDTRLGGQSLSPNVPTVIQNWDTLEIAGYSIILLEGAGTTAAPTAQPPAPAEMLTSPPPAPAREGLWQKVSKGLTDPLKGIRPAPTDAGEDEPTRAAPPPAERARALPSPRLTVLPPDQPDDVIIVELSQREWDINVEQTASCQVSITNGGRIVAAFVVRVAGISEDWVTISYPGQQGNQQQVNLNDGERTTVTITITPPREPFSRAGVHHLAVIVTSPNYPGRSSQRGATLTIYPYYEFAVGELSPKQQTVGGRNPTAEAVVHIANKGNSDAAFRLEAMDDERALSFEFEVPGEITTLAQQAEMRLPIEETFAVPIHITPISPPLIGLRNRNHSFTVTAAMLEGALTPRSLLGQLKVRPLIGPWLLALFAIFLAALVILIFQPRITDPFMAHPQDDLVRDDIVNPGETVRLTWATWPPFTHVRIEAKWFESGVTTPIVLESGARQVIERPPQDVIYTLTAENFLSNLLPFISSKEDRLSIDVFPLEPRIIAFNPDPSEIVTGQDITLRWRVENADEVDLSYRRSDGNTGEIIVDPSEFESGNRQETPPVPTSYELCVTNKYSENRPCEERTVTVREPTPTPLPVPIIRSFSVTPREIYVGQNVTITWEVDNATSVKIVRDGIEEEKTALTGETIQTLTQLGVAKYKLLVIFDDGKEHPDGPSTRESDEQIVTVREKPTPTPEPQTPVIEDFRVVPSTVVRDDDESIQLVWSVVGDTTNIEISGPVLGMVSNLPNKGSIPVSSDATTFFMLTAYNEDLSASQTVELTVEEPTPLPPPTPIPPQIVRFEAEGLRDTDVVIQTTSSGPDYTNYIVTPGTKVRLLWTVNNAPSVDLSKVIGGSSTDLLIGTSPEGIYEDTDDITQNVTYQLHAESEGQTADRFVVISVMAQGPPPPPYNVDGDYTPPDTLTVTWQYDPGRLGSAPNEVYALTGFRIYRAGPPFTDFSVVADVAGTDCIDDPAAQCKWTETASPACGYIYYITGVYEDRYGDEVETAPSSERYSSGPCPTPTP
jgi:hypothetical protein